jgi:hypothetical protein
MKRLNSLHSTPVDGLSGSRCPARGFFVFVKISFNLDRYQFKPSGPRLGMRILQELTDLIHGTLAIGREKGSEVMVEFPTLRSSAYQKPEAPAHRKFACSGNASISPHR